MGCGELSPFRAYSSKLAPKGNAKLCRGLHTAQSDSAVVHWLHRKSVAHRYLLVNVFVRVNLHRKKYDTMYK